MYLTSRHSVLCAFVFVVQLSMWVCVESASAQQPTRIVKDPPLLNFRGIESKKGIPRQQTLLQRSLGEAVLDLNVVYTDGQIWNPAENRFDQVRLRSYQGTQVNPNAPYVSPTIEVFPGETVRITLNNRLPADPSCTNATEMNIPHCFNGTNLHAHGLWVNPSGNGDNVLISINPGVTFQYEYKIPPDHPSGTFWYHTHRHGSTALQVSSGMAGALIVRGRKLPTETNNGDIDTLLRPSIAQPFSERVVVMQQIQYACRDAQGKIKLNPDGKSYKCDPGDTGSVEGYDQFGPPTWRNSGRYTSINGLVLPTFTAARSGKIERWRIIHGGVRDTISLQFREMKENPAPTTGLRALDNDKFVGENCTGTPLPQHLIAADGLTLGAAIKTDVTVFQPAYRWDALLVFPKPGIYCLINAAAPASNVGQVGPSRQLLGFVVVENGEQVSSDISAYLMNKLVAAAGRNMSASIKSKVIADLGNGLKLRSFVPHDDIQDDEITGTQELAFNIDVNQTPLQFQINGRPYDSNRIDRTLKLGAVDEWTLKSEFVGHPFHIHVNPFQIVKILDPNGKDVSGPDAVDSFGAPAENPDPQYRALKGVWKDTLWVKNLAVPTGQPPGQYTLIVRTRYRRYIGDFVLHCHILDHEDQGMMQNVRIALPDGAGGITHPHP
jgi:L-ascorbate oxidase